MAKPTAVLDPKKFHEEKSNMDQESIGKERLIELKNSLNLLRTQLELERSTFRTHWMDIADHIRPRRGRFLITDVNKGGKRNQFIVDDTATQASGTLRAGMMSGITSPSRPWFRLSVEDPDLADNEAVKIWLYNVTQRMSTVFLKSNLYSALPIHYGDMGDFGTAATVVEEDFEHVVRFYPLPIGSYSVSNNNRGKADTICRDFRMTVRQLIEQFGYTGPDKKVIDWSKFSMWVKNQWENRIYEAWVDVTHIVCPNDEYHSQKMESRYKKYLSVYYERGGSSPAVGGGGQPDAGNATPNPDRFLSMKGYDEFPVLVTRWETTGEDFYGTTCPGMNSLGNIRELQLLRRRMMQAIEKQVNPPLIAPTRMKNQKTSVLPGDINYDDTPNTGGMRPVYEVKFDTAGVQVVIEKLQDAIKGAFYTDMFLMMAQDERRQPATAEEIREKQSEKLLALGPVMENLNQDCLDPLVTLTFQFMWRQGLIPPPPPVMKTASIKVEYTSIMAQAQKLLGIAGLERFGTFIAQGAQVMPEMLDKVDGDKYLETYGDMVSLAPSILRSDEAVAQIRQQRQQQQQAQAQAQQQQQKAETAQTLAKAPTGKEEPNALTDLMDQGQSGSLVPSR